MDFRIAEEAVSANTDKSILNREIFVSQRALKRTANLLVSAIVFVTDKIT
jgi:hypothetical protein